MKKLFLTGENGFLATIPMSIVMLTFLNRTPPKQITKETLQGADIYPSRRSLKLASLIAHFGFGTLAALPYIFVNTKKSNNVFIKGSLYGLIVWGTSYLLALPAFDSSAAAPKMSAKKNLTMIASHIVWGVALATLSQYADKNRSS